MDPHVVSVEMSVSTFGVQYEYNRNDGTYPRCTTQNYQAAHRRMCLVTPHLLHTVLTSCNRHAYFKMLRNALYKAARKISQDNIMYICLKIPTLRGSRIIPQ